MGYNSAYIRVMANNLISNTSNQRWWPVAILNKTSDGHISVTRHLIYFVFGSRLGFLARITLFNLTAHELHELYYDRPTF